MNSNKYGRIFTQADVEKIVEKVQSSPHRPLHTTLAMIEASGESLTFPDNEPVFVLRARDKRARGAVRFYADHQTALSPPSHINAVEEALKQFNVYANNNPELMREPD